MKKKIQVIAFVCGAVVMVVELVGSRLLAPYVGTSVLVWTSLIGVVMASLAMGYFFGGRLADQKADTKTLVRLLFLVSLALLLISFVSLFLPHFPWDKLDTRIASVLMAILLFTPATIVLGMVPPYSTRLLLGSVEEAGKVIGSVSALSTLGSIVGTFLGGFVLIAFLSTLHIFWILALVMAGLGLMLAPSGRVPVVPALVLAAVCVFGVSFFIRAPVPLEGEAKLVADRNTDYGRFWVYDVQASSDQPAIRYLTNSIVGTQSATVVGSPTTLVFDYTKMYDLFSYFAPQAQHTLLLGGGAYSYPKYFLEKFQDKTMDVVEIDPGVTRLAEEYFEVKPNDRMQIFHEDGRVYLNKTTRVYDAIFVDAFLSYLAIPFQLTTVEAVQGMHKQLSDDGVVMVNIISALEGPKAKFLEAELATYESVFADVSLYRTAATTSPGAVQNIFLVARKSTTELPETSDPIIQEYLTREYSRNSQNTLPILTDALAPVEWYISALR